MGRILIDETSFFVLAALIYQIKYRHRTLVEMMIGLFPSFFTKKYKKAEMKVRLDLAIEEIQQTSLKDMELKYRYIKICSESPLAMSVQLPVD